MNRKITLLVCLLFLLPVFAGAQNSALKKAGKAARALVQKSGKKYPAAFKYAEATKAKKAIGYAIAGLVIATLSYAITLNYVRILNNISSGKDPSKVNEALVPTDKDDIQKAVEGISERAEP